ncbi:MAG: PEP-CTERM sorting domain-containing protein [Armatimonadetes bacterium]|nr:PEP-CTERM sorting domain-containing protein [Armatimonadota bacterium]
MKIRACTLAISSLFIGFSVTAQADVILDTFGSTGGGFDQALSYTINTNDVVDRPFSVNGTYSLDSIDVALIGFGSDLVQLDLCSDDAGNPGSIIESFSILTNPGTTMIYSVTSVLQPVLSTGNYHLKMSMDSDSAGWCWTTNPGVKPIDFSFDQGATWHLQNTVDITTRITATAVVPEPASFAVLGLGAFALIRRRRTA